MRRLLPPLTTLLALAACSVGPKPANSDPVPPSAVDLERPAATVTVDARCDVDADCVVKDVGSCCGYAPACLNVDAATDPAAVKSRCDEEGLVSTCGFREIGACRCNRGTCEAL